MWSHRPVCVQKEGCQVLGRSRAGHPFAVGKSKHPQAEVDADALRTPAAMPPQELPLGGCRPRQRYPLQPLTLHQQVPAPAVPTVRFSLADHTCLLRDASSAGGGIVRAVEF